MSQEPRPGPSRGVAIDVRSLLTIDVDAELRKLATAQLQGPWQIPAELVRRSLSSGAGKVELRLGRNRVSVVDDGGPIPGTSLASLAVLLDPRAPTDARHRALLDLEEAGSVALLALGGLEIESLELRSGDGAGEEIGLELRRGRPPRLERGKRGGPRGTRVTLVAEGLDPGRARSWLADVARFAGGAVSVNGEAIADGLEDYLVSAPVRLSLADERTLEGHLAIPRSGDTPRLWLLQHGLVATHQGLTKSPTFDAILELGPLAPPRATAADLRELVAPLLGPMADEAARLMLRAAERLPTMGGDAQRRLLSLLLQSARLGRRRREIEAARLIPCMIGHGEPRAWRSIADLRRSAEADPAGQGVIAALYPGQESDEVILGGPPVAILDAAARSTITELFGIRFRPPPRQLGGGARQGPLGDAWERLGDLVGGIAAALHLGIGPPLPDAVLSPAERLLVEHLRAVLPGTGPEAPAEITFCRGRGPVRQTRGQPRRLLLPRDNPEVKACARAVATNPAWVYPAGIVLLRGRALPSVGARSTWLREWANR